MRDAHVDHEGELGLMGGLRERRPIWATIAWLGMACDEDHAVGMIAMGERHIH